MEPTWPFLPVMLAVRAMAVTPPKGAAATGTKGSTKPPTAAAAAAATADAAASQRAAVSADYAGVANQTAGCCVSAAPSRGAIGYTDDERTKVGGVKRCGP